MVLGVPVAQLVEFYLWLRIFIGSNPITSMGLVPHPPKVLKLGELNSYEHTTTQWILNPHACDLLHTYNIISLKVSDIMLATPSIVDKELGESSHLYDMFIAKCVL